MRNVTGNALFVIRMCVRAPWSRSVTSAISVLLKAGASFVAVKVFQTLTTAKSAHKWKRIGMAAPK